MKAKLTLTLIFLVGILNFGCKQKLQEPNIDIVNEEFAEEQTKIEEVVYGIFTSIQDKDPEKLKSYHLYGPKFTAFASGMPRQGSKENEESEKKTINSIISLDYNLKDLKIAVYGEVAIVTYHGDFEFTFEEGSQQMHTQTTLIFVETEAGWKIAHEHSSPRLIN